MPDYIPDYMLDYMPEYICKCIYTGYGIKLATGTVCAFLTGLTVYMYTYIYICIHTPGFMPDDIPDYMDPSHLFPLKGF